MTRARATSPDQAQRLVRHGAALAAVAALGSGIVIATSGPADAQVPVVTAAVETIMDSFAGSARRFEQSILRAATTLFIALAVIDITWAVAKQLLARSDLFGILSSLLHHMVVAGFFFWLMLNGPEMARAIINTFLAVAGEASAAAGGTRAMSPADTIGVGAALAQKCWAQLSIWSARSMLVALVGMAIVAVFAMITGRQVQILIEAYFMASVVVILLGLGGALVTRDYAVATFRYAISVGLKLLVLQLLVSGMELLVRGWADAVVAGDAMPAAQLITILAAPMILLVLVETLPQQAQAVITGTHVGAGSGLGAMPGMAAAAATTAAVGMVGGGAAAAAAFRHASAQLAAREADGSGGSMSSSPGSRIARAAQITGMAAGSLGRAAAADMGQRLTGNYAANHGHAGWRMSHGLNASAAALRAGSQQSAGAPGTGASPSPTPSPGGQVGAGSR